MRSRADSGQATVELVALLPCLAAVLAVAWQFALAGHATWAAAAAARAAARAAAVGADPEAAARAHLPSRLEKDLDVRPRSDGTVEVRLRIPTIVPATRLGSVHAEAGFPLQ